MRGRGGNCIYRYEGLNFNIGVGGGSEVGELHISTVVICLKTKELDASSQIIKINIKFHNENEYTLYVCI